MRKSHQWWMQATKACWSARMASINEQKQHHKFALNTPICLFDIKNVSRIIAYKQRCPFPSAHSWNPLFPPPQFSLSIFPTGLLFCSEMVRVRARQKRQRETAYMPVARHFQANITKQTQTNKLGSLSASLSLPSAQTALPSLSGLPDMLIAP